MFIEVYIYIFSYGMNFSIFMVGNGLSETEPQFITDTQKTNK